MTESNGGPRDFHALLGPVIDIARRAGERIVEIYEREREISVERKEDKSPLTEADMAAHHVIVEGLRALTPDLPVLSEESASVPFAERAMWREYWLVDPLDGTREFIKRNGEFTVNIALIAGHEPVLGVIVVPVTGVCYFASRGHGAFEQRTGDAARPIRVRPLDLKHVIVAGSRSHGSDALMEFLAALGSHELISMGSSLKFCLVAQGNADVYVRLGLTSEWDTAAAHCVVVEAGGRVTDIAMQPLRYNTKESLLNPHFFASGDPCHDWSQFLPKS